MKEIFPKYLLLLSIFPIIVGTFIDYELVDSREIILNLVWLPLFTIPILFFKSRTLFQLTNLFYFIIGLIEITHWVIIKGPISVTSILIISNTNLQESIEFFDLKTSYGLLILILFSLWSMMTQI